MTVKLKIVDAETGAPLSGVVLWTEYNTDYDVPFTGGVAEIISSGAFTGAERSFTVYAEGYVPHEYMLILHDGVSYDIGLYKWWWYEKPALPPEEEKKGIAPLLIIGAALAAFR